jgi:hypothetical protein
MNLPYESLVLSIMQLFIGLSMFAISFSKKQHRHWAKTFSEKFAYRFKAFTRYGGLAILCFAFFLYSNGKYTNAKIEDTQNVFNQDRIELLQNKAGQKEESGWYVGEGANGNYSIMFPAKFKEFKIPTKNNSKCPLYYSASTQFNGAEYLVEYIQCGNFDTREIASTMLSQENHSIISITEKEFEGAAMLDIIANTPEGKSHIRAIYRVGGQYSLSVRSKDENNINIESIEKFHNSFNILEN